MDPRRLKKTQLRTASVAALLLDALVVAACSGGPQPATPPAPATGAPSPSPSEPALAASSAVVAPVEPVVAPEPAPEPSATASASTATPPPMGPDPTSAACVDDTHNVLLGLKPARPAPYVDLRWHMYSGPVSRKLSAGVACATATDPAACAKRLDASPSKRGFGPRCGPGACAAFLAVQFDGATTSILDTPEAVMTFLGPIDTADEAALVAYVNGYGLPACKEALPKKVGGAWVSTHEKMTNDCPMTTARHTIAIGADGSLRLVSETNVRTSGACAGRRPPGLAWAKRTRPTARDGAPTESAAFLAECAELEAASVVAFERLAAELSALGAPQPMRRACRRAAADEVRHTRVTERLARRRGASPRRPVVAPLPLRGAEALALDNAVEGCVRETFGALIGLHQAQAAADPAVRRAMRAIAADEVRHAALAWRIAGWLEPRLTAPARRRVERARAAAIRSLRAELALPPPAALEQELGVPGAERALAMAARLETTLWA